MASLVPIVACLLAVLVVCSAAPASESAQSSDLKAENSLGFGYGPGYGYGYGGFHPGWGGYGYPGYRHGWGYPHPGFGYGGYFGGYPY